jgi:hypothetical protein
MVTLQRIYDKLGGVAKTGQAGCWDASGIPITCAGTGQDGAFQKGATVSPRFTDNANGTVKDNLTGLIWLKNANCFGPRTWTDALVVSNTLTSGNCGLMDGSVAGNWRLPNLRELQSLIDLGQTNPALPAGHPFSGVASGDYWSSTTWAVSPNGAQDLSLFTGWYYNNVKNQAADYVLPVRSGQ